MSPEKRKREKIASVPRLYRKMVQKAIHGSASPRDAIKAQCLECVGYVRAEVISCPSFTCPLYMYRPYKE